MKDDEQTDVVGIGLPERRVIEAIQRAIAREGFSLTERQVVHAAIVMFGYYIKGIPAEVAMTKGILSAGVPPEDIEAGMKESGHL